MAITKTVTLKAMRFHEATVLPIDEPATLWVDYEIMVDDPDDDDLPVRTHKSDKFFADSDVNGQEQIIQDIFKIVFKIT